MEKSFFQDGPSLSNTYQIDPLLRHWVQKTFSAKDLNEVETQLNRCGEKAATSWLRFSEDAEAHPPVLQQFDAWGRRVDHIQLSSGWSHLEDEAAIEGIVASAYERKFGALSRPLQMSLLYLFHPSSAFVSCPLAMTDGAARCLEVLGTPELKAGAFRHLTTRQPSEFWTSGQWMTERTGGSDVSMTSTIAKFENGQYRLYGPKWFTSATHSQMSMLLAKIEGSDSLSLFYIETHKPDGSMNHLVVHRLKDKLGTKALPTAELDLCGTPATLVGNPGQGVKNISYILNITRVYNSVCATSHLRRGIDLLQSYSEKRVAFGKKIKDQPLHASTLAELEQSWRRCFAFTFHIGALLGKEETGSITEAEKIELRCMTPILKLYTAKACMVGLSEICEGFGGAGYVENTGIPRLLRDAQVFSIWEGTTNVLALDFLRAFKKEAGASQWVMQQFAVEIQKLGLGQDAMAWEASARKLVFEIARAYTDRLLQRPDFNRT